jgi:hypothetical protein
MQSSVVEAEKMEAARLALHPSYQQEFVPTVGDPEHIRNFVHYYRNLRTATSVTPATGPAPNNPWSKSQARPQLPDQEELDWWDKCLGGVGDGDEGRGGDQLNAVRNSNQEGESGLGDPLSPPAP